MNRPLICRLVRRTAGFTLIEMAVVLAAVAILIGAVGMGLRGGDQTVAAQRAQSLLSSMVAAARGQAAMAQRDAAIIVWGDPDDYDTHLRQIGVFVLAATGPDRWRPVAETVRLPDGIFFVPPDLNTSGSATTIASGALAEFMDATSTVVSSSAGDLRMDFNGDGTTDETIKGYLVCVFTPVSTLKSGTATRVVLSPAERSPEGELTFSNYHAVRGLRISTYGIAALANDYDTVSAN